MSRAAWGIAAKTEGEASAIRQGDSQGGRRRSGGGAKYSRPRGRIARDSREKSGSGGSVVEHRGGMLSLRGGSGQESGETVLDRRILA